MIHNLIPAKAGIQSGGMLTRAPASLSMVVVFHLQGWVTGGSHRATRSE